MAWHIEYVDKAGRIIKRGFFMSEEDARKNLARIRKKGLPAHIKSAHVKRNF